MKKTTKKKLQLSKETITLLETGQLKDIAGGGASLGFSQCFTMCNACPDTK